MNLDQAAVSRLLRLQGVMPTMARALADFSSGRLVQPLRQMLGMDPRPEPKKASRHARPRTAGR
jgi:hypothetical protein